MTASDSTATKRRRLDPNHIIKSATLILKTLQTPLKSSSTNSHVINSIRLTPANPNCTIGRCKRLCHFVLDDPQQRRRFVSRRHCHIQLDAVSGGLCIVDGFGGIRASLNGVFVNGVRVGVGKSVALREGDVVGIGCGRGELGFGVERIVVERERERRADGCVVGRAIHLLSLCRSVLESTDPISSIRQLHFDGNVAAGAEGGEDLDVGKFIAVEEEANLGNVEALRGEVDHDKGQPLCSKIVNEGSGDCFRREEGGGVSCPPPGKRFYLNNLESMNFHGSGDHVSVSLPELLHPVKSLSGVFIATFTSDIPWFLGSCKIPVHLPVTIACHNTERCWSAKHDRRFSLPFPDFPKLVVVYPPFPEAIAFGSDRTKRGVACHHPKLLLLLREQSVRVIITSANLNEKQWNRVTNTVWWQDFPRATAPDYLSLFSSLPDTGQVFQSDFAAQLARLVAIQVTDVPSQAYWVTELANYDFRGASGHLVVSVPGIHSLAPPHIFESILSSFEAHALPSHGYLGSVEAFVVGLSHLFCTKADSNGVQLKKLALCFANCRTTACGMLEVVLRRNKNITADANAVSVFVPNQDSFISEGDFVQLGFLPRDVARWVSPVWDAGFFSFSGYVYPREAIEVALGNTSGKKVRLSLHVSQGPKFSSMSSIMQGEHAVALCSLIASVQRRSGLWRLQEVVGRYSWPEPLETDFVYGSSSVGSSISPQFLATFSAAIGKRSLNFPDSEESDPEWGRWTTSQESKNPSMKILFPSIERVKNSVGGIMPSKRVLCLPEKTWQKLRPTGIFHDAVPHPEQRVGHPMHVKVAMRRFQSKRDASSSFGWVYCGSHNFSAAAWGRVINTAETNRRGSDEMHSSRHYSSGPKLHICNYEVGIVFLFPTPGTKKLMAPDSKEGSPNIDNVVLPFVMPPPKYKPSDRPATFQALREAMFDELAKHKYQPMPREEELQEEEEEEEEMVEEEPGDVIEAIGDLEENEDEKAYAEELWSQVDSSQSC